MENWNHSPSPKALLGAAGWQRAIESACAFEEELDDAPAAARASASTPPVAAAEIEKAARTINAGAISVDATGQNLPLFV
jgi:hypothetical protein